MQAPCNNHKLQIKDVSRRNNCQVKDISESLAFSFQIKKFPCPHVFRFFVDLLFSTRERKFEDMRIHLSWWMEAESRKKKLWIQKYPDTCERDLGNRILLYMTSSYNPEVCILTSLLNITHATIHHPTIHEDEDKDPGSRLISQVNLLTYQETVSVKTIIQILIKTFFEYRWTTLLA